MLTLKVIFLLQHKGLKEYNEQLKGTTLTTDYT